jgi:defect-in-organelle-trafficking protein DotA
MMVFYSMLVVIGLNKAFSLIYILPDRIMRWIGQPGEQSNVELDQMKQGSQEMGRGVTDTGSTGASGAGSIVTQGQTQKGKKKDAAAAAAPSGQSGPSAS